MKKSLGQSATNVRYISPNCEKEELDPEIWAPAALFRALRAHRWVINTDEQDAHEFFQVLLSTVEEELQKEPKIGPTPLFDTTDIETSIVDLINNDNEDINLDDRFGFYYECDGGGW